MARLFTLALVAGSAAAFAPARSAPAKTFALRETAASAEDVRLVISDVPGKSELDEMTAAKQVSDLDSLSARWQRQKDLREWEESRLTGWSEQAEIINGRTAMFFLIVGLLTELWTGQSIPEQVVTMARVGGFIGL